MKRILHHPAITILGIALIFSTSQVAAAELKLDSSTRQNTLLELYTSQGCSSCPPAECWLGSLQEDPRLWREVIPLAFHVDYWDYIGWKDPLAKSANSARQQRYHSEGGLSAVYTPGFVVNGQEWRNWHGLRPLPENSNMVGRLTLQLSDETITASYHPATAQQGALRLNVAVLGVGITTQVTSGENAGKKLPQDFVVLAHTQAASTNGQWQTRLPAIEPVSGVRLAIAAWVNREEKLAPLQAVGGWLGSEASQIQ
jgi:hypothetical protein